MQRDDLLRVAVAYSGGRDSTALLHATLQVATQQVATQQTWRVFALHVNHGLSRHATRWQRQAQAQCKRWAAQGLPVEFVAERIEAHPAPGDSIEAWARQVRYAALQSMLQARGIDVVLLAHHQRDQAETFVLQALRAAGVAGQAGMAQVSTRNGITWLRPWLHVPRERIDAYVAQYGLSFVEDDSNEDTRFARNRLRRQVWPALTLAFPQAEASLAAAATWAQQASVCLDELADIDLAQVATPRGLDVATWRGLGEARASNVLRAWVFAQSDHTAPASLVTRLLAELAAPGPARWPCASGELRRYRGLLRFVAAPPSALASASASASAACTPAAPERTLRIVRTGTYVLPGWHGRLRVERTPQAGVPLAWLAHLELVARSGGERFQAGIGRPPRSLKKQFQAAGLPAWEREGPLLYSGGQLVYVPGLGLDARILGLPGQPQVSIRWLADSP